MTVFSLNGATRRLAAFPSGAASCKFFGFSLISNHEKLTLVEDDGSFFSRKETWNLESELYFLERSISHHLSTLGRRSDNQRSVLLRSSWCGMTLLVQVEDSRLVVG